MKSSSNLTVVTRWINSQPGRDLNILITRTYNIVLMYACFAQTDFSGGKIQDLVYKIWLKYQEMILIEVVETL